MGNREIIEALIFSSGRALSIKEIQKILPGLSIQEIERYIVDLNGIYEASNRSFRINLVATGYMFVTLPEHASFIRQLVTPVKLTGASLEVLAVIAYKGPCSKQTIDGYKGCGFNVEPQAASQAPAHRHQVGQTHDVLYYGQVPGGLRAFLFIGIARHHTV